MGNPFDLFNKTQDTIYRCLLLFVIQEIIFIYSTTGVGHIVGADVGLGVGIGVGVGVGMGICVYV